MADDKPLKPTDFPLQVREKIIVTNDGKTIANACDEKTAGEVADRLNTEEEQREEDRWSA